MMLKLKLQYFGHLLRRVDSLEKTLGSEEAVPGPSVFPSGEPGVSGDFWGIDGSPLGSCVPGILQARTLEWVAISFSNA